MKHWLLLSILALGCIFAGQIQAQLSDTTGTRLLPPQPGEVKLVGGSLNSSGSVLAPFRYADKLFFTATVPVERGSGRASRIFSAIGNEPAQLSAINPKEEDVQAGHAVLNTTADRIYYTVFKETTPEKQGQSEICYREKQYDGTWGSAIKLPKHVNKPGTNNSQPAFGHDLHLKKDLLFFVSNRAGGEGGFDIWYCTVERDGAFGDPVNLPFNTAYDDVTPFYSSHAQMVFFSSNRAGGKGGFDIYRSEKNPDGNWQMPENLGSANSAFDDLYFSYHQPTQTSYFCSNRPNDNCQNSPSGCTDLSVFAGNLNGSLFVNTRSEVDSTAIFGCNIELENVETGAIELAILNSETSSVELPISPGKKYRVIVSRPFFFPVFLPLEPTGFDFAHPIRKTVYLRPMR